MREIGILRVVCKKKCGSWETSTLVVVGSAFPLRHYTIYQSIAPGMTKFLAVWVLKVQVKISLN